MKRIIYTFFLGLICMVTAIGQPTPNLVLNQPESGTKVHQATNSITFNPGYSYTPNGGTFLAEIVNPVVDGITNYESAIDPSTYSINTLLAVGKTPGELNVSGIASYTVPLDLPKGTAGLQPNLSLNYTSDFNDGLMGVGWNLGGLSEISRVGQNLYFETQANPVMGDLTDRFALDGNRMIVTNGSYGADLSVYGTELEDFSKITARGGTGKGPAYFEVRTKSGLICEYGNTSNSKILRDDSDSTCILTWKVNKITDRYGNYITFTYFESDDERLIYQILYGAVGKDPCAQVNFRYKQRSDISTYTYGGKEFSRNILLDNIEVKNNGQSYKKYKMGYMLDNYAQLQKVTEYNSQNQVLNPLIFSYTTSPNNYSYRDITIGTGNLYYFNGDFNGDGYIDMVTVPAKRIQETYTSTEKWKLYLGSSTGGMIPTQAEGFLDNQFVSFQVADMDGDGYDDLLRENKLNLSFYKSNGNGFLPGQNIYHNDLAGTHQYNVVDYNGDGILEIMRREKYFGVNTNRRWEPVEISYSLFDFAGNLIYNGYCQSGDTPDGKYTPTTANNRIVDINGDGRSDLIVLFKDGYIVYTFENNGSLKYIAAEINDLSFLTNMHVVHFGDFNGDRKTDILTVYNPYDLEFSMLTFMDNREEFKKYPIDGLSRLYSIDQNSTNVCDINGDGKSDILFGGKGQTNNATSNRIGMAINKGNGYEFNFTEYESPLIFNQDNATYRFSLFGDFDCDGFEELFYRDSNNSKIFKFSNGTPGNLLTNITDGFGAKTKIIYKPMSNVNVYTRGSGATYPLRDFISGMQLVRQVDSDDGIGGSFTTTYKYEGAKIHLKGKGFLGFAKIIQTIEDSIFTEDHYTFESPYYYPKLTNRYTKERSKYGTSPISSLVNTWNVSTFADSKRIFPYISSSTETDDKRSYFSVTSTVVYPTSNLYGNPTSMSVSYSSGPTKTTSFLYDDEKVSDWLIGRPTTITETSTSGSDTQTFTTQRSYFPNNNSPDIDQYNVGDDSYWQLNRDYDVFGNLSAERKATTGLTETKITYEYDNNGVNLLKVTDQIGNPTLYTWYPTTGFCNTQTDPFGNVITYNYDLYDQLSSIVPSSGISTGINSSYNVTGGPAKARYYVNKTGNDNSKTVVWYDCLGRELRTESKIFGGSMVKVDRQYDSLGDMFQFSEPTTGIPTASSWNKITTDKFGRISQIDPVFEPITEFSYAGARTIRMVNTRQYITTENAAGLITSTQDPGGTITNTYWPNGQIKSSLSPLNVQTTFTYDKNGNRTSVSDPSAGNSNTTWYGTGQMKSETNAELETTTYTYSPNSKVLLESSSSPDGITRYTYYSNGLVNTVTSPGYTTDGPSVTRAYTYDKGKVLTITESIDGVSNKVRYFYDSLGRLSKKFFNETEYEEYVYDSNCGYLYQIKFVTAGITTTVWEMTAMDAYKRTTQANIGTNPATWKFNASTNLISQISATGVQGSYPDFDFTTRNLISRQNTIRSRYESFGYDLEKLDRLTSVTGPSGLTMTYTTDKSGNIQTKSDAGTYAYDASRPYAVDQITNGKNISSSQQMIRYTAFGKVKQITEDISTAEFDYNADQQRVRMVMKSNGSVYKTRYYFGGSCEREVVGSTTTQYIWIGGDAYTAVAVAKKVGTGAWTIYNIFRDHLGTIEYLKNGSNPADEYSFDAWGRRRDKDNWSYTLTSEPALFADRGFTGHEYLEEFKLYNMNGRLYDPVVGRFLSPDPFIQDPSNTQSYNRYSYCLNNPLKYTDPSGYTWWSKFTNWVGEGFSNAWDWMNDHPMEFGFSSGGPNGPTYFVKIPSKTGNPGVAVGVNPNNGMVGFGNNSSGFMQFYFPQMNYDVSAQNAMASLDRVIIQNRAKWMGASNGFSSRDATRVSIDLLQHGIVRAGGNECIWGAGDIIELGGFIKPNIYTPKIGFILTANNVANHIANKEWDGVVWDGIEYAGGIYSVGFKGLFMISQTQHMQQGVNQIFRQEYMRNQNLYETTGDYEYRIRALHYNELMKY